MTHRDSRGDRSLAADSGRSSILSPPLLEFVWKLYIVSGLMGDGFSEAPLHTGLYKELGPFREETCD